MAVSMQQVKELRERTQAGLNDCKLALQETDGDMEAAVENILKKGLAKSAKRAGAAASEGIVVADVLEGGAAGVILEVNIQTDFAARNADFLEFVKNVFQVACSAAPGDDLGEKTYPGTSTSVEETRKALVGKLGENILVRRWARVDAPANGRVSSYVHMGGRVGVLVAVSAGSAEQAKGDAVSELLNSLNLQIAAMSPLAVTSAEVDPAEVAKQRGIFDGQLAEEGKPEAVRGKIIEGKLAKWYKEICLLDQESILDSDKVVSQLVDAAGSDVKVASFVRYERGEGVEKKAGPDFATEVAQMAAK